LLAVSLDPARNQSLEDPIGDPASRCFVRVRPRKKAQIAAHTSELASGISQFDTVSAGTTPGNFSWVPITI
jgi:hypothetical protein